MIDWKPVFGYNHFGKVLGRIITELYSGSQPETDGFYEEEAMADASSLDLLSLGALIVGQ